MDEQFFNRVLIVDDEQGVLDGYQRLLRREFQISVALGGEEGLEALAQFGPFAVVISDMRMPGMDGAQFLAEVKKRAPDTIRMLLTGYADMNAAMDAINRGNVYRFLTKPCTKEMLVDSINLGLDEYQKLTADREVVVHAREFKKSIANWGEDIACHWDNFKGPTGLPGPTQAREYLRPLLGSDQETYVVMFRLTALPTIENRYGEDAASGCINAASQFLMQSLERTDRLFHWDRDVLMGVIRRTMSLASLRQEFMRITSANKEQIIRLQGRSLMISSPISFEIQSAIKYSSLDILLAAFNTVFLKKQS